MEFVAQMVDWETFTLWLTILLAVIFMPIAILRAVFRTDEKTKYAKRQAELLEQIAARLADNASLGGLERAPTSPATDAPMSPSPLPPPSAPSCPSSPIGTGTVGQQTTIAVIVGCGVLLAVLILYVLIGGS